MIKSSSAVLLLMTTLAVTAFAGDGPEAAFGRDGITLSGLTAGSKIAWIGFVVEPRGYHVRARIVRGFAPSSGRTTISIPELRADETRGLWAIMDVTTGKGLHARAPRAIESRRLLNVEAIAGRPDIVVHAAAIELLYVRPPAHAWYYSVADGGDLDGDRQQNGVIVVPLRLLQPFQGNPHPPEAATKGDVLLVIDPWSRRTGTLEVAQ